MKNLKLFITGMLLAFISITNSAYALTSSKTVTLTDPAGGDILPGGKLLAASDVKSSIIFSKLIPFVIKYTIRLAIALSVIALIIGGYQYMTAYGDAEKHKTAQKTITYAILGLIVAIAAFGIVKIITSLKIV